MANSADVVAGTAATAAQFNNLRADVLNTTTGHGHTGSSEGGLYIGYVPVGGIIMWYGSLAQLSAVDPSGHWHVCDGTSGTIDMQGRMPIGINGTYTQGSTGGSATVDLHHSHVLNLNTQNESSHTHTQITATNVLAGAGTDKVWTFDYGCNVSQPGSAHLHLVSGTTGDGGSSTQSVISPYKAVYFIQRIS